MTSAAEIAAKHCGPRFMRLDVFEKYVAGSQYEGRWPFLQESDDAPPLLERAPCIVDPIVSSAIRSHCDFCLGEGRWPLIGVKGKKVSEDDEASFAEVRAELETQARLPTAARQALENALGCGTDVALCGIRNGSLFVESLRAAWCTPVFADDGTLGSVEIRYPYIESYFDDSAGKYADRCMLFRRVIDTKTDITFEPLKAPEDGSEPKGWTPKTTVVHDLGFCPVVWYAMLQRFRVAGVVDGKPMHEGFLDEIDALNRTESQRHRAALYAGDPLKWESGVDLSNPPGQTGRDANVAVEVTQDGRGPHPKGTFRFAKSSSGGRARKIGAGAIWSSESPDYKVGQLTLPGDALKAIEDEARDLRSKLHEAFGIVDLDIENAKIATDMSGKAQAIARQRQVNRDNIYRQDFGDGWLIPVARMLLRIGAAKNALVLPTSIDPLTARIDLAWGPYFQSTAADQKALVELVDLALKAKVITRRIAIEKLKAEGVFPIDSADAVASEPTLEDALAVSSMSLGSETFDRIYKLRLVMSLLGDVDPKDAKAIESELDDAAAHSTELREAMVDGLGGNRKEGDEGSAEGGDEEPERDEEGGRRGGRFGGGEPS